MNESNRIIAKNIQILRKEANLNQLQLAELLGCSNTTISMWMQGNSFPRSDKIDKMCKIFKCSRQDLLSEDLSKEASKVDNEFEAAILKSLDQLTYKQKLRLALYVEKLLREEEDEI